MAKIYLPSDYVDYSCKVINNGYIRVYTNNSNTEWTDIYINQDYQLKKGNTTYSQNIACDNINIYTDNIWYRVDIDKIIIVFFLITFIIWYLCSGFFNSLFKGPRRL